MPPVRSSIVENPTSTQTQETTVIHLPAPSLNRAHFENRAQELLDIRKRFHHPQHSRFDTLSQKLSIWIRTFIQEVAVQPLESVERIQACTAPYLAFLDKKILRDELRSAKPNSPVVCLKTPVRAQEALEEKQDAEEDLVWEKHIYLRCRVVCKGISPFSGRPMPENPIPHAYAQAVIDWKATLFTDARESFFNREVTVMPLPTEEQQARERVHFYELAECVKLRRVAKKIKQQTQAILRTAEASEQETFALLTQRTGQAALEEAHDAQLIQKILTDSQAQIDEMTALMVSQQQTYKEDLCFFDTYLKTVEEDNRKTAAAIRKELDQVRAQQEQTDQAQAATVAALKQEQTQTAAEFQAHQTLMETRHQTELLRQANEHSGLKQAIKELKGEVTAVKQDLTFSQQVAKQQKQRIQQLDATNAVLEQQLADAVSRANNAKEVVVCSLM